MATQREIKKILEKINFVLEELSIQDAIADEKLYRVVEANTPEEFLYKNAELIDLKRQHDTLLTSFPNNLYFTVLKVDKIKINVVTSTKTEKVFETGKDDEVDL